MRCWHNAMWAVLLPEGHRLPERHRRHLRLPLGDDTLRLGLLSEGDGVRQRLNLDVCHCGRRLHTGPDAVWQGVLLGYGPSVRQWYLHSLHHLGWFLRGGGHLLHAGPGVHQHRLPIVYVSHRSGRLQLGLAVL
jgi:hypothetical protein